MGIFDSLPPAFFPASPMAKSFEAGKYINHRRHDEYSPCPALQVGYTVPAVSCIGCDSRHLFSSPGQTLKLGSQ